MQLVPLQALISLSFLLVVALAITPFAFIFLGFFNLGRASDVVIIDDASEMKYKKLRKKGWAYTVLGIVLFTLGFLYMLV